MHTCEGGWIFETIDGARTVKDATEAQRARARRRAFGTAI